MLFEAAKALAQNESHPGHDKAHPGYAAWQAKKSSLAAQAWPDDSSPDRAGETRGVSAGGDGGHPSASAFELEDYITGRIEIPDVDAMTESQFAMAAGEYSQGVKAAADMMVMAGLDMDESRSLVSRAKGFQDGIYNPDPERTERDLRAELGDRFDATLAAARRAVATIDAAHNGKLRNFLNNTGAGDDGSIIMLFAKVAQRNGW
jgi:hypothetical protein